MACQIHKNKTSGCLDCWQEDLTARPKFQIINRRTQQVVATCDSQAEANEELRKFGEIYDDADKLYEVRPQ